MRALSASASRTQLTETAFRRFARKLMAVGCFASVAPTVVDLAAAARRGGAPVFTAPFSNTRPAAIGGVEIIIMLMRR